VAGICLLDSLRTATLGWLCGRRRQDDSVVEAMARASLQPHTAA
jgi:hypothetical protein